MNKRCEKPGPEKNIRAIAHSAMQWLPETARLQARQLVNGAAQPAAQPDSADDEAGPDPRQDLLQQADAALTAVIAGDDPERAFDPEFIRTVAHAGHIKAHEIRRHLKAHFGHRIRLRDYDELIDPAMCRESIPAHRSSEEQRRHQHCQPGQRHYHDGAA